MNVKVQEKFASTDSMVYMLRIDLKPATLFITASGTEDRSSTCSATCQTSPSQCSTPSTSTTGWMSDD